MKIWLVKLGEPLPGEGVRTRRMTVLATTLVEAGHEVVWWTSDWNHQKKCKRDVKAIQREADKLGFRVEFIHAPPYGSNLSPRRLIHHAVFSGKLVRRLSSESGRPALLWVCFPVTSVAMKISRWAKSEQVKLVFDVRDVVPDVFVGAAPKGARPLIRFLTRPVSRAIGSAFSRADGIVAVSAGYLAWAEQLTRASGPVPKLREVIALGYQAPADPPSWTDDNSSINVDAASTDNLIRIVFAGTLGRSYDLLTIIKTAERCLSTLPTVRFVIAGGGSGEPLVREAAERLTNLDYLGWLDASELHQLLSSSHAGLMAYREGASQGLPNKIYEYMANGLVILNSLPGEAREFVDKHKIGINYTAESSRSLLDAIRNIVANKEATLEMARNAATLFSHEYSYEAVRARMRNFVEHVYHDDQRK